MRGESQGLGNSATRLTASEVKSEAKLIVPEGSYAHPAQNALLL